MTNVFDNTEFEKATHDFQEEVKNRWGHTSAYSDYRTKTKDYSKDQWNHLYAEFDSIFGEFAHCMNNGLQPSHDTVQVLVTKLQDYITVHFYQCTNEIFWGLGEMYICDERFKSNIDKHSKGTAAFVSEAIKIHCQ